MSVQARLTEKQELPSIIVHNPTADSVTVVAGFPAFLAPAAPSGDDPCRVSGDPAQAILAPYDSLAVSLTISGERPPVGEYRGSIPLVVTSSHGAADQYCLPVRLGFDQVVWVPETRGEPPQDPASARPIAAWPIGQEGGRVSVEIVVDAAALRWFGAMSSARSASNCRIVVVNILGQHVATINSTLASARFIDPDHLAAVIEIDGSETWSSGVYPCRVSIGAASASFSIVITR
jgi:hypothetical protein